MQFLGLLFLLAVFTAVFGPWFLIIIAGAGGVALVGWLCSESEYDSSPEARKRRAERREQQHREREEACHAMRMAAIERQRLEQQAQVQLDAQKKADRSQLLGTATKFAVSAGLHALSNGAIKHRHRH